MISFVFRKFIAFTYISNSFCNNLQHLRQHDDKEPTKEQNSTFKINFINVC